MCPVCFATVAWIAAGTGSAGGLTAFVVKKLRSRSDARTTKSAETKEKSR